MLFNQLSARIAPLTVPSATRNKLTGRPDGLKISFDLKLLLYVFLAITTNIVKLYS